jgi:hypothetical protein
MSGRVVSRMKATEEDNQNTFGFVDGAWEYRHAGQLVPIADLSLDMMAIGIKSHRVSAERCFSHGVEHAIGAGELLIAAKKKVNHGGWLPWLETQCGWPCERRKPTCNWLGCRSKSARPLRICRSRRR